MSKQLKLFYRKRTEGWVRVSAVPFVALCAQALFGQFILLGQNSTELRVQIGHYLSVNSVAISESGDLALTGGSDGGLQLWDVHSGYGINRFNASDESIVAVALSPDGKIAASGGIDQKIRLWNVYSGKELEQFSEDCGAIVSIAYAPAGHSILITGEHGPSTELDVKTGRVLRSFGDSSVAFTAIAISPDGHLVATGSQDGTARIWNEKTGTSILALNGHSNRVTSIGFSPDNRLVISGSADDTARIWNVANGRAVAVLKGHSMSVSGVAITSDSSLAITGSLDGTIRKWDINNAREIARVDWGWKFARTNSLALSPKGDTVIAGNWDGNAMTWSASTFKIIKRLEGKFNPVGCTAFSFTGRLLVTGCFGTEEHLWDLTTGKVHTYSRASGNVASLAMSQDEKIILTGGEDAVTREQETATGNEIATFHGKRIDDSIGTYSIAGYSSDSRLTATAEGNHVEMWDTATGNRIFSTQVPEMLIRALAISPDVTKLVAAGENGISIIWNAKTGSQIGQLTNGGSVRTIAFSADGKTLATGGSDKTVHLWDIADGHQIGILRGHSSTINSVVFSQDGRWLISGSDDKTSRVWNVAKQKTVFVLVGHSGWVRSVAVSSDDLLILTGSQDGTSKLWNLANGVLLATLVSSRDGGWAVVSPDGRFDTSELDGGAPLSWIVSDAPMRPLPLEIFMRQYYTPRLLPRLLAHEALPPLPRIASLNRVQPEVKFMKVELDPNHSDALRAVVSVKSQTEGAKSSGARDLRIFRDGQLVGFREGNLSDGEYVFDNIRLAHKGPQQEVMLTAYAFNRDLVKSETVRPELPYKVPANWPERQGRAFLVNIGVNRTSAEGCDLHYTVTDATTMQSMLTKRLQDAGYGVEQHLLISDDTHPDGASKSKLESALREIAQRATPDDLFILSYSGHGYTDQDGVFYLFPSDLKGNCRAKTVARTLMDSAISSDQLTEWIRPIDAGEMVMILDACYSSEIVEGQGFKPGPMGSRGLGQLAYDKRIRVLAASQAKQPAGEAGRLGMGYLSYALLKDGLEKKQADWQPADNFIWLREWLAWGVKHVPDLYSADPDHTEPTTKRGFQVNLEGTLPLQTPALFDFRTDQDRGLLLQKLK